MRTVKIMETDYGVEIMSDDDYRAMVRRKDNNFDRRYKKNWEIYKKYEDKSKTAWENKA